METALKVSPSELRIRNFLQIGGKYYKVASLNTNAVACVPMDYGDFAYLDEDKLEPIPLTPEILEKAGFEKTTHRFSDKSELEGYKMGHRWFISLGYQGKYGLQSFIGGRQDIIHTQLEYLHQLQNLYFALTGEELEITL